ncbi:hypothetical protein H4219_005164 [Mycoemilia scoparia]|uniref:Major facilitator superfamily (MFS) profile domain-containing protein n=1 Tax=Mycoemilia scoparia TaxID=417184 RepID=A0A9W7ZVR1_9FUNG|nr:hypothetical protein H4219_005164 [Mycoemilia scoparia]
MQPNIDTQHSTPIIPGTYNPDFESRLSDHSLKRNINDSGDTFHLAADLKDDTSSNAYKNENKTTCPGTPTSTDDDKGDFCKLDSLGSSPNEYPDGGYGWVVVICCFLLEAFTEGPMAAFGVYQEHYVNDKFKGEVSNSTISFIGTLAPATMSICGLFGGKLCERFGFKLVPFVGVIIISLGYLLASFSNQTWQLFITQGFMTGMGTSLAFLPAVSTPSQWFYKRRGLATGFVVTGVGAGGMLWSLLTRLMISKVGSAWSLRITAMLEFGVGTVCLLLIKTRFVEGKPRALNWNVFKDIRLWGILGFFALASLASLIPLFYLPSYATSKGYNVDTGALLVTVGNLSSTLGRLITSIVSDYIGSGNIALIGPFLSSLSILCIWTVSNNIYTMLAFAVCYGFGYGTIYTQTPVVIARLFGVDSMAVITGAAYTAAGPSFLSGGPLAGLLLEKFSGTPSPYLPVQLFSGIVLLVSLLPMILVRLSISRKFLSRV